MTIDTLTGEMKVDRVDILHDVGRSINPAIDIGQIEGGFVQGMGWLTTEELVFDDEGRLRTHAPATYKIPTAGDVPADFRVALFDNENREDTIGRSKAVGEPPLMLAISVFNAIADAIHSLAPGADVVSTRRRRRRRSSGQSRPHRRRALIKRDASGDDAAFRQARSHARNRTASRSRLGRPRFGARRRAMSVPPWRSAPTARFSGTIGGGALGMAGARRGAGLPGRELGDDPEDR